jgi:thiamine kinase-like enzyme
VQAVHELTAAALAYVPASHLLWALWGLIQARQSSIDFDFEAYARQRLQEYQRLLCADW